MTPGFVAEYSLSKEGMAQGGLFAKANPLEIIPQGCCTCLNEQGNPISRIDWGGWAPFAAVRCVFQCGFRGTYTEGACPR